MIFEEHKEKVAGTSYYKQDLSRFNLKGTKVPSKVFAGWIEPEPENQYDEHAKKVVLMLPMDDGGYELIHVGYLKKDGWLYKRTKVCSHKLIPCQVKVQDYSSMKWNDSYTVIVGQ